MYLPLFVGVICWSFFVTFLQSSCRGGEDWLLCVCFLSDVLLMLVFCGSSSRCHGLVCVILVFHDHVSLLFFIDIIKFVKHSELIVKYNIG